MTGYTVHTGSTDAFANNYDQIFGAKKAAKKKTGPKKKSAKVAAKKKKKRTKPKSKTRFSVGGNLQHPPD